MSTTIQTANHPLNREQAKVMGRFDLISRMVRKLHKDEAVIGGIGYTNFDLWAASGTPMVAASSTAPSSSLSSCPAS